MKKCRVGHAEGCYKLFDWFYHNPGGGQKMNVMEVNDREPFTFSKCTSQVFLGCVQIWSDFSGLFLMIQTTYDVELGMKMNQFFLKKRYVCVV